MKRLFSLLVLASTLLLGLADAVSAHGPRGRVWGGVAIGIGVPLYGAVYDTPYHGYGYGGYPVGNYAYGSYGVVPYGSVYAPGAVVAVPPPLTYSAHSTYSTHAAPVPAAPATPPEPIFYPRNGQSPARIDADRQACNRWAGTQPNATADASVFQRATQACMDARGYTSR